MFARRVDNPTRRVIAAATRVRALRAAKRRGSRRVTDNQIAQATLDLEYWRKRERYHWLGW